MTAQTVASAVAVREDAPTRLMWTNSRHFAAVLPDHIDVKSFIGTAAAALYASDDLMKAASRSPDSLIAALMRCAALGHQPGTEEFYLTPRKGAILGIEGYRGIVERMYRSGAVKSVIVREVCAKDQFRYVEGEMDKPVHHFGGTGTGGTGADFFGANGSRDRGQMVGVYAYAILTTGAVSRVVILTRDDVLAAKEASDASASSYSPWNRLDGGQAHPEFTGRSMWWKTAARRLEPWVPTSAEYRREQLRAASAAAAGTVSPGSGSPPVPVTARQSEELAHQGISTDVYDAELVDDDSPGPAPSGQPAGNEPAAGPGPAASRGAPTGQGEGSAASTGSRAATADRPTGAMLGNLGKLMRRIPLGPPEDEAVFLAWQTGRAGASLENITRAECDAVMKELGSYLGAAGGDVDQAAETIWIAYAYRADVAAGEQDAAAEAGQTGG